MAKLTAQASMAIDRARNSGAYLVALTAGASADMLVHELNNANQGVIADLETHQITHAKGCDDAMTVVVYTVHVKLAPARPAPLTATSTVWEYPEGVFHCTVCGKKLTQAQAAAERCPNDCTGL